MLILIYLSSMTKFFSSKLAEPSQNSVRFNLINMGKRHACETNEF